MSFQKLGTNGQRPHQAVGVAQEMGGAVEIGAEPFVRVEDNGIGILDAAPEMAEFRTDHRGASPGRIDMNIKTMAARDVADACNVIRAADTGAADAGNDADGQEAGLPVG